jgi:glycosyltransferase involved in cell wall biosynthesis
VARLRVLHAIQNLNYGGMERLFADIVRLLDSTRFESHVLIMDYLGRFGEGLDRYATIHHSVPLGRWSMLHPGPLTTQIRAIAPDIVHTHAGVWYKVSLAARRAGTSRIVHTEHGRRMPDPWLDRKIGWLASRRTDVTVAVSETLGQHLRRCVVAHPDRVAVVPNGVDTELYVPRPESGKLREELGLPPGCAVLGSIGRLEHIKGYDIMIEAFARLRGTWNGEHPPVLVIAGEGAERPRLEAMLRERNLAHAVHILGWRDDTANLHAGFTLFTMTSRSEGTSVSLLEAMSAGLVPLVTRVGGNAAVLGPDLQHRLVASMDPDAVVRGWKDALANPERLRLESELARARIVGSFSLAAMVERYQQLYQADQS